MRTVWVGRFLKSAVVVLGVGLLAVGASGLWLSFRYEPASCGGGWVKDLHVVAGWISLVAVAAIFVTLLLRGTRDRPNRAAVPAASLVLASLIVGFISGRKLPWTLVTLREVTVGSRLRGVWFIGSHDPLFVWIPGGEIEPGRYRLWLAVHILVVPICMAAAVLAVVIGRRARDRRNATAVVTEPPVVEVHLQQLS
jgi:predicted membrane-bound mannosyltransferase